MTDKPKGRIVTPAASFQPPDTCPDCAAGVPFGEDAQHGTAETPWEDLRRSALASYEEAATKAHSWSSVIPRAINYYFENARTPTPSSAEARARARELVDEWRNTWRGMSDACMTANRIDLIDRIARLSTPQPTLQCGLCDSTDLKFCAECFDKPSRRARARSAECERLVNEREALRVELEKLSAQPSLQQAIEKVKELRDKADKHATHNAAWAYQRDAYNNAINALSSLASTQE